MGLASVCSMAMFLLLFIDWLYELSMFGWVGVVISPCYALLSGLAIIWPRKNSCLLYFNCLLASTVSCLWCYLSLSYSVVGGLGCSV